MDLQFDLPKEQASIIKVIGVGGGGSNAVNHMFRQGIVGVNFVVCNTDGQALEISPIPNKIQLGPEITQGLGAGSNPDVGRDASEESLNDIQDILSKNTKMVFVTAGMGGGTGTGGAPVIARIAKEMGILTVGIVTTPFSFEGRRKLRQAEEGIQLLKNNVDTILIVSNDKIREIYGNLTRSDAFGNADNILATAAKSISEIITVPGEINVDFADVEYVMKDSGVAIMGSSMAEGEDRAVRAVQGALNSPLLNDSDIRGAKNILINITSGARQVLIDEITEINDYVQDAAGNDSDIIFGTCDDDSLGDKLSVTIIATGFAQHQHINSDQSNKVIRNLESNEGKVEPPKEEKPERLTEEHVNNAMEEIDPSLDFELKLRDVPGKQQEEISFYVSDKDSVKNDEIAKQKNEELEDRKKVLKDLSYKWNNSNALTELENEPAYKRRNVQLSKVPESHQSNVSRFTLSNDNGRPEIRKNNSFLHDNVD
ncbi:MAG: cell division protein FtsZ [Chitinophagales bacterium]|nr:cell division protein FtsZ [Chitinophagales bacterium]